MDCYPEANLNHAKHILRNKTLTFDLADKVFLSFGLNRNQGNPSILDDDLKGMLSAATATFPQAQIFIPLIRYSERLSKKKLQANIKTLNDLIKNTGHQNPMH